MKSKYPALAQIDAYWHALRVGNSIPARSQIDPRGIEDALEYTFILERIAPGVARFRIAGMHLNDLLGMDVRGMPTTSLFAPMARREIGTIIEKICNGPRFGHVMLKSEGEFGRPSLKSAMLLLPLTDDFGAVTRILGCLQSTGRIGRQPRRFLIADTSLTKIEPQTVRYLETPMQPSKIPAVTPAEMPAVMPPVMPAMGFSDIAQHFTAAPKQKEPGEIRPALRLVADNT